MRIQILRLGAEVRLRAFAQCDEEMTFAVEDEARTEMQRAVFLRLLAEDHFDVLQLRRHAVGQVAARDGGAVRSALTLFGIAQIDQTVFREAGIECDVEQTALPLRHDLRHAVDRVAHAAFGRHDAQKARPLGDQEIAVGQEGEAPGMLGSGGDRCDADFRFFGRVSLVERESGRGERGGESEGESGAADHAHLFAGLVFGPGMRDLPGHATKVRRAGALDRGAARRFS